LPATVIGESPSACAADEIASGLKSGKPAAPEIIAMDPHSRDRADHPAPPWPSLRVGLVVAALAACASPEPGPVEFAVTAERTAKASCRAPYGSCPRLEDASLRCNRAHQLAEQASTSVIAIDERGHYAPVVFTFEDGCEPGLIRQPTPGIDCEPQPDGPPAERFTDCFVAQAKRIRATAASSRRDLLIFIHGGLNSEQNRLERAFIDANRMLADSQAWYPLFVTWPSGGLQSYVDQRVHYNQGDYDSDFKRIASPLYFLTDAVESVVRAPVAWAESISWVQLGQNDAVRQIGDRIGCEGSGPNYRCVPLEGRDDRSTAEEIWYWSPIGFVGRVISVPVVDAVGQPAWDAMVSRTRMLMRKPFNDRDFAAADGKLDGKGDLWYLFNVLSELPADEQPPITLIGHSMGAIVVNEILSSFPDLPYRNIVFMGAAASVRDTVATLDHLTRAKPRPDLRFYNLSLHQDAEAGEVDYLGTVSKGSLLEWVDRMYTTPSTFADRTVGKWVNTVMAHGDFLPLDSRLQMSFKRFGLSCAEPLKHTEFDEYEPRPGCPDARTPYWDPAFWTVPEPGG
jgi:hypothetical protein